VSEITLRFEVISFHKVANIYPLWEFPLKSKPSEGYLPCRGMKGDRDTGWRGVEYLQPSQKFKNRTVSYSFIKVERA
jgi:hypothetical protein